MNKNWFISLIVFLLSFQVVFQFLDMTLTVYWEKYSIFALTTFGEVSVYLCAFSSVCGVLATDAITQDFQPRFLSVCILIVRQCFCNLITYNHDLLKITAFLSINASKLLSKMKHSIPQFKIIVSFSVRPIGEQTL